MKSKVKDKLMSHPSNIYLDRFTTFELEELLNTNETVVILLPVGSVEPHGPHLSLATDTQISQSAAEAAIDKLSAKGITALIAPSVPYGVTNCAAQFKGAVTVAPEALTAFLSSIMQGFQSNGFAHCCAINNHLEPEQDQAVRSAVKLQAEGFASIASPLTRRWARTLTDEYKKGECHAGQYETSIILAGASDSVRQDLLAKLNPVPVSLSDQINKGVTDFLEMGMEQAYAGSPADASVEEGLDTLDKLAEMICVEVTESLAGIK
jgi:creatinine amidohydrolase